MALPGMLRPRAAIAAVFGTIAFAAPANEAHADTVTSTPKGIVGGALLGADVVTIVESLAHVRAGWAYGVGAVVGAAGGGIGGYFVEQGSSDGKAPMYLLAGGLALVIPAIVLTLNATRYQPEEGAVEDHPPTSRPADPGAPGGSLTGPVPASPTPAPVPPPPVSSSPTPPPQSLLDLHRGAWRVGVPLPDVRPVFSLAEQRQYGAKSETELRLAVIHGTF